MKNSETNLLGRMIRRAGEIWGELDYAQQRLFEIRTGVSAKSSKPRL